MRLRSFAALAAGATLLAGCADSGERRTRQTIDVARASGEHARATAEGIAKRPLALAVRMSAAPKQRVTITWGLSCPKTEDGKSKGTGGTYVTSPPNVRALRLPRRAIAFCAVRAEAQLSRSGRVRVTLLASRR